MLQLQLQGRGNHLLEEAHHLGSPPGYQGTIKMEGSGYELLAPGCRQWVQAFCGTPRSKGRRPPWLCFLEATEVGDRGTLHGDDHLPLKLVFDHVPERLAGLTQRVGAVDDGGDLPGFE